LAQRGPEHVLLIDLVLAEPRIFSLQLKHTSCHDFSTTSAFESKLTTKSLFFIPSYTNWASHIVQPPLPRYPVMAPYTSCWCAQSLIMRTAPRKAAVRSCCANARKMAFPFRMAHKEILLDSSIGLPFVSTQHSMISNKGRLGMRMVKTTVLAPGRRRALTFRKSS
jgi:hypothetical protein